MNVKHVDSPTHYDHVFAWTPLNSNESKTVRVTASGDSTALVRVWSANGWQNLVEYPLPDEIISDNRSKYVMHRDEKPLAHRRNLAVSTAFAQRAVSTHFDHEVYAA